MMKNLRFLGYRGSVPDETIGNSSPAASIGPPNQAKVAFNREAIIERLQGAWMAAVITTSDRI